MGRSIAAILIAVLLGAVTVFSVEYASHMVYPPPPGLDMKNPEAMKAWIATLPVGAMLFVCGAWLAGAFVASLLAGLIARAAPRVHSFIAFALMTAMTIVTLRSIEHPGWMWAAGPLACLVGGAAGATLTGKKKS